MPDETPSTEPQAPASTPLPPADAVPDQRDPSDSVVEAAQAPLAPPAAQSLPPTPPPAASSVAAATPLAAAPPEATPVPTVPDGDQPTGPAPSKRVRRLVATLVFGVIVLVLLAAIGYLLFQRLFADATKDAKAGDCLADLPVVEVGEDREVTSARIVACTDPAAAFVVEGRLDRISETQASGAEICQAYEDATFIYRAVPAGGTGYVLCLRQLAE